MLRLDGKIAFVTGAGSVSDGLGNGRAISVLLARQGAAVFGTDINITSAEATLAVIAGEGGRGAVTRCDMTNGNDVKTAVDECLAQFGRIDILVNNVGGSAPGDVVAMEEVVWDRQIELNLKTVFLACKHVLPVMQKQGAGSIVNISSMSGLRDPTDRHYVAYAASKAAVIRISRSIALAYAKDGIRCNTVIPGMIKTSLVTQRLTRDIGGNDPERAIAARVARVPLRCWGDPWDVAYAVLFLVSQEAKYITATDIVVDGGLTATRA